MNIYTHLTTWEAHMKYSDTLTAIIEKANEQFRLTPRERKIFELIAQGCNDDDICSYLGISKCIVQHGVYSIVSNKMFRSGGKFGIMLYLLEELDHEVMNAEKRINEELDKRSVAQ